MHFRRRERNELAQDTLQRVLPKSGGYGRDGARCRSTKDFTRLRKTPNGSALSRTNPRHVSRSLLLFRVRVGAAEC